MKEKAFAFIDQHCDQMLALWEELVNIDSGSDDKEGVDTVVRKVRAELEAAGLTTKEVPFEKAGNMLVGQLGHDRKQEPLIFMGHMDTVFAKGTVSKRPFRIQEGKAYGPGCLDMKGGIVAFLYAIKALNASGYTARPIKVLLAGDEENGHPHSNAPEIFMQEATGAIAAFNCETGFVDDSIVVGRKGVARFNIEVQGVAAHVGNDPEKGRSAIVEIAHKLLEIEKLTDFGKGTTFNVGVIQGGTVPNATPDYAKIQVDVRFVAEDSVQEFTKQLEEIAARTYVQGTTTTMTGGVSFKPMQTDEGVMRLFELIKRIYQENGLGTPTHKQSGGGSDSAYTVLAGVPTVCSMGVKGGRNHSPEEFAVVETLFERTKLLIACVLNLK